MGLILAARCGRCDYARSGLAIGATMAQMSGETRSFRHLHRCPSCRDVAAIERALGEETGTLVCPMCGGALDAAATEYRVVRMKGLALEGHACPRCGEAALSFREEGKFL